MFGCITKRLNELGVMLIGCKESLNEQTQVHFFASYDVDHSYTLRASFMLVDNTTNRWTLNAASRHQVNGSDATALSVIKIYGII